MYKKIVYHLDLLIQDESSKNNHLLNLLIL